MAQAPAVSTFERVAHEAARRAGAVLRARYRDRLEVTHKGAVDLVTAVDREAEHLILEVLSSAFPDHAIVAEESGVRAGTSSYRWYVDPIDGTTNFAHGFPHFAVSIALEDAHGLLLGVVFDPIREEMFSATRAEGARLNGSPIRVSPTARIADALLATGFPYDRRSRSKFYLAFIEAALQHSQGIRCVGSAALDLCWVACGRVDAYWEWNLHAWDTAAGELIIAEAGGRVTGFSGQAHRPGDAETAASNGHLHQEMLAVISGVQDDIRS